MTKRKLDPLILAMHGVQNVPLNGDPHRLFISPSRLRMLIDRLSGWGYAFATFAELARGVKTGDARGHVALTFDDGYRNNLYNLVPILEATGAKATVFVVSGWLGKMHVDAPRHPILSSTEVAVLHREGVEIGCHTVDHKHLPSLDPDDIRHEFVTSKGVLEDIIGGPVDVAAYPYGEADATTRAVCKDAGFIAACRTSGHGSWDDPLDLPRQDLGNSATVIGLDMKSRGVYEPFVGSFVGRVARHLLHAAQKRML
jgi:peptidoglycan/xylan/chitin deacetylase (PgdA/CDA1 family)